MAKKGNWVKISRKLLDNPLWKEKPFSKGQAWLDLILRANWKKGYARAGYRKQEIRPGQLWTTQRELADRWGWPPSAVNRFLRQIVETGSGTVGGTPFGTLITLENWALYQLGETPFGTLPGTQSEKPTINIRKEEEGEDEDPFGDDDEGLTEEELDELLRV